MHPKYIKKEITILIFSKRLLKITLEKYFIYKVAKEKRL
jgi:hypothetical protein